MNYDIIDTKDYIEFKEEYNIKYIKLIEEHNNLIEEHNKLKENYNNLIKENYNLKNRNIVSINKNHILTTTTKTKNGSFITNTKIKYI